MGGRAAQLAKLVAVYSPWQFVYWYDRPEKSPRRTGGAGSVESVIKTDAATRFYNSIPTVWDETRFLEGEMGKYAVGRPPFGFRLVCEHVECRRQEANLLTP